jgi:hypothetical protein
MPGQCLKLPLRSPVCGKVRHYTKAEAQAHLEMLKRCKQARGVRGYGELVVYRCERCQAWHVGHQA